MPLRRLIRDKSIVLILFAAACAECSLAIGARLSDPIKLTDSPVPWPVGQLAYNSRQSEFVATWNYGYAGISAWQEIAAQRFSTAGELLGTNLAMANEPDLGSIKTFPRLAYNDVANEYLFTVTILARDLDLPLARDEAKGHILSADLTPKGPLRPFGDVAIAPVTIFSAPLNEYFYAAHAYRPPTGVYATRINSVGEVISAPVRLNQPDLLDPFRQIGMGRMVLNPDSQGFLNVRAGSTSRILSYEPLIGETEVWLERQLIALDGGPVGSPLPIVNYRLPSGVPAFQDFDVALDASRRQYLLTYEYLGDVRAQLLDEAGNAKGQEVTVFDGRPNSSTSPSLPEISLAFDPINEVYLLAGIQNESRVWAQLLDPAGRRLGSPLEIVTSSWVGNLDVAFSTEANRFAVLWSQGVRDVFDAMADVRVAFVSVPEPSAIAVASTLASCIGTTRRRRRLTGATEHT